MINQKGEYVSEFDMIAPFGPTIYSTKLNEKDLKFVKDFAELNRNGDSKGYALSGNIEVQRGSKGAPPEMQQKIFNLLMPHIQEWFKSNNERGLSMGWNISQDGISVNDVDYNSIQFGLGEGVWFNYMKAGEFNPTHDHNGTISGIVMVDVPEEIAKEPDTIPIESNARCPGQLEWIHGSWGAGNYRIVPVTGQLFMFPAKLRHQVYPFKTDVERLTMSWNVYNVMFNKKVEIDFG